MTKEKVTEMIFASSCTEQEKWQLSSAVEKILQPVQMPSFGKKCKIAEALTDKFLINNDEAHKIIACVIHLLNDNKLNSSLTKK